MLGYTVDELIGMEFHNILTNRGVEISRSANVAGNR
jgi:hypothetical protein